MSCSYRLVACPAYSCKKQISYTGVKEHIFGDCTNSFASVTKKSHTVLDDRYIQCYTFEREFSFKVSTFSWYGKYFFLSIIKGDRPYANFYVQMLGDEEDCRKLLVTLSVRDQVGNISGFIRNKQTNKQSKETNKQTLCLCATRLSTLVGS